MSHLRVTERQRAVDQAKNDDLRLVITGNGQFEADVGSWLSLSPFAKVEKTCRINMILNFQDWAVIFLFRSNSLTSNAAIFIFFLTIRPAGYAEFRPRSLAVKILFLAP